MNKDIKNLIKNSTNTFMNIAQMTQYRIKYVQEKDAVNREKMYKHAFLAGAGIISLFMIGIAGLVDSRRNSC